MGVCNLHTYVESVNLGKPLTITRSDESSERRVVIVDVCALMLYLYGLQSLLGDFSSMRAKVERLVECFAAQGVDIVAVIDGAVPPEKVATWLARRRQDAKTVAKINQSMRSAQPGAPRLGKPPAAKPPASKTGKPSWLPPAFSQSYLGQAFRAAGCRVIFTTIEADRVAAGLATELGALGVLGHDSDFFICASYNAPFPRPCLSCTDFRAPAVGLPPGTRYLDFNTMKLNKGGITVMSYEQEDMLRHMGIPRAALPLLAADLGFDLVSRSSRLTRLLTADRERRAAAAGQSDASAAERGEVDVAVVDASGDAEAVSVSVGGADGVGTGSSVLAVELALKHVRERMQTPEGLEPTRQRELAALEWYKPAPPLQEGALAVTRPHVEVLLQHRTFMGPLCVEDLTTRNAGNEPSVFGPSVFEATAQLRAAVYKRLFAASQPDADVVTEFLCSARCEQPWVTTTCRFTEVAPAMHPKDVVAAAAPGVTPAQAIARHVVERWLKPYLTATQARALVRQADPVKREAVREEMQALQSPHMTLRFCWPENVHAATLFLVAMDIFCFGCRCVLPAHCVGMQADQHVGLQGRRI